MREQALIPGLPEDVALECIARVPHLFHSKIRPVCRKWRDLVTAPSFSRHRRRIGAAEDLIFIVQALKTEPSTTESPDPVTAGETKEEMEEEQIAAAAAVTMMNSRPPVYTLSLYNATLDTWHRTATSEAIPMFSHCVAAGEFLVLIGGWDPVTLDPVAEVRILHFPTMTWRRGRSMTSARSFFACAAAGGRVYVAGGHDAQKNALRTAEAYDLATDEWVSLPPMAEERDESRGLILGGKFWAVSGYRTENQGRFATSAEWYDADKEEWRVAENAWDDATCASCFGTGEVMVSVDSRGVREMNTSEGTGEWRGVGPAPEGMRWSTCGAVMGNGERVFVTGGEGNGGWVVDMKSRKWAPVVTPLGFTGFAYSAAAVRV